MADMQSVKLEKHVFATYISLRIGMAFFGFALPLILAVGGGMIGISLQDSMSDYYHALSPGSQSMRDWLVGILFAIGAFLYLYKGFTRKENVALNLAGIFAVLVALFPVQWECGDACKRITAHAVFAISFFLCTAYVCVFRAQDTLKYRKLDGDVEKRYRRLYRAAGIAMLLSPLTALVLTQFFRQYKSYIFFAEAAGVWSFSAYWLLKSCELRITKAERRALRMPEEA